MMNTLTTVIVCFSCFLYGIAVCKSFIGDCGEPDGIGEYFILIFLGPILAPFIWFGKFLNFVLDKW